MPYRKLCELIHSDIHVKPKYSTAPLSSEVLLEETSPEARLKPILVRIPGKDNFIFKLDTIEKKSNLLSPAKKHVHRGCDYIIITPYGNGHIVFIELKSRSKGDYLKQFENSDILMCYLADLLKKFDNVDITGYKKHYVLFSSKPLNKQEIGPGGFQAYQEKGLPIIKSGQREHLNLIHILNK